MKKALVIRLGAWGDVIMASPLFRLLKQDGYYTVANVNPRGKEVLESNPYVDEIMLHIDDSVPNAELDVHWKKISEGFDRVINLSGSIEKGLLKMRADPEYHWPKAIRHEACNVNYYDRTLNIGGYGHLNGLKGELYFSPEEEAWAKKIRDHNKNRFMVLWSLSGSSVHKTYPYADIVAKEFLERHKDAVTFTVGDYACSLLEWDHPRNKKRSGVWNIRKSFVMAKYADLVVGAETGVLNAAGCFKTPKVVMLSHSSHENLSKYWENCVPVHATEKEAPCYPCHKMIYKLDDCLVNSQIGAPFCTAHLRPETLMNALETIYKKWEESKHGVLCL